MAAKFQTRSVSLPSRSHPTTVKIDEELNKLRTFDVTSTSGSSSSICNALSCLGEVYNCLEELFNMSLTQEALARSLNGKCLDELMDGSVKLLDTCEVSKDVMSKLKEEVAALQSAIRRRRKGSVDGSFESSVSSYVSLRKKARKDAKKLASSLKQMEISSSKVVNQDDEKKEFVKKELLGDVEGKFEEVEKRLENVFRKMIKSRASMLNILSQ
ncbi:hypothetical protein LINPERPRIM_LOCUS2630 [Linum perenne]